MKILCAIISVVSADDCTYNFQLLDENGEESNTGAGLLIASRSLTNEVYYFYRPTRF